MSASKESQPFSSRMKFFEMIQTQQEIQGPVLINFDANQRKMSQETGEQKIPAKHDNKSQSGHTI